MHLNVESVATSSDKKQEDHIIRKTHATGDMQRKRLIDALAEQARVQRASKSRRITCNEQVNNDIPVVKESKKVSMTNFKMLVAGAIDSKNHVQRIERGRCEEGEYSHHCRAHDA